MNRMLKYLVSANCAIACACLITGTVRAGDISVSPVYNWDETPAPGTSTLVRTDSGVTVVLETTGIPKGQAVTVWFVVFNNPDECEDECNGPDFDIPAVMADALYAAGHVVGGGKQTTFAGHLNVGDTDGSIVSDIGLVDAKEAEIHLVVRSHGPKLKGQALKEQIQTFDGGCVGDDLDPGTIPENPNECADLQFAVHQP